MYVLYTAVGKALFFPLKDILTVYPLRMVSYSLCGGWVPAGIINLFCIGGGVGYRPRVHNIYFTFRLVS